jgi:hypothetical protein
MMNKAAKIIMYSFIVCFGYAIIRYHIAGTVPWKDLPFYVLNKGVSLTAIVLLTLNFSLGPAKNINIKVPLSWLNARKAFGMAGFLLVLIHALMSFLIFKPSVYASFFEADNTLTLIGGLSMLGGIFSFVILWAYNLSFQTFMREDTAFITFITSRNFLLSAMLLAGVHLFFMGYKGWMNPSVWNGGLPPISLVGFIIFCIGYAFNLVGRK